MPKNKNYIILYADEFSFDAWEGYCEACGVSKDATEIKIYFNEKDVEAF